MEDGAFIVGGQALNLWAELYHPSCPALAEFAPYTSKDLDYFGQQDAAAKLAKAIGGEVLYPDADDPTPNSALVRATVDGQHIEIDFIRHVLGVRPKPLEALATELIVPLRDGRALAIPLMHPLHCLQSRVANVCQLGRSDATAMRQLRAAPHVLKAYLADMLSQGDLNEVQDTVKQLYNYLLSDIDGRKIPSLAMKDPAEIISTLITVRTLDWRFRWFNLRSMRRKLRKSRDERKLRATQMQQKL